MSKKKSIYKLNRMYFSKETTIIFNEKVVKVAREDIVFLMTATAAMLSEIRSQ